MIDISFNQPFFDRGDFPPTVFNGSQEIPVPNPWGEDNFSAPFNERECPPPPPLSWIYPESC
jgi:hypothetical protein